MIFLFGDKLKELRKQKKISQSKLGEYLNVTSTAVYSWEMNRTQPPFETLKKIAEYFGVSTDYLLDVDYDKFEKLKTSLKENGMMQGDDLSIEELEKALKIVETLKENKN